MVKEDIKDAYQKGKERPDLAWVCTDKEVWHRNPFCVTISRKAFSKSLIVAQKKQALSISYVLYRRIKKKNK